MKLPTLAVSLFVLQMISAVAPVFAGASNPISLPKLSPNTPPSFPPGERTSASS